MMLSKCLVFERNMEISVRISRSLLYLFFIILFLAVLGYYLGEWIADCRKELQVLLYCGFTVRELSISFQKLLILLEIISWFLGSIIFGLIFHGSFVLFGLSILGALGIEGIFVIIYFKLFFGKYSRYNF